MQGPGAGLLSPIKSIISARELNFWVREGIRCDLSARSTQTLHSNFKFPEKSWQFDYISSKQLPACAGRSQSQFLWLNVVISTPRLNTLLCLHLKPIKLIVYKWPIKSNLGDSFTLICFQRLSKPNIATLRCPWQDSRYTRGSSFSVLSY